MQVAECGIPEHRVYSGLVIVLIIRIRLLVMQVADVQDTNVGQFWLPSEETDYQTNWTTGLRLPVRRARIVYRITSARSVSPVGLRRIRLRYGVSDKGRFGSSRQPLPWK